MNFRFKRSKKKAVIETGRKVRSPGRGSTQQAEGGTIKGKEANSLEEWRVAQALNRLKIRYDYQVAIFGGRAVRGGLVVDFVIYNPWKIPLMVHGEYWHNGRLGADDAYSQAAVRQYYGREPVVIWGREVQTVEDAVRVVSERVL